LSIYYDLLGGRVELTWYGQLGDVLEETDDLGGRGGWRPFTGEIRQEGGRSRSNAPIERSGGQRFYRVRKP
jgi:hypothetical protein